MVNNSRFLVLPERQKYPNLASRLLGLCLKRLNADWQERWAHPVVLVETYVDESQYRGTCYRACGFKALGFTAGYGRSSRDYYEEHGVTKQLYVRELRRRATGILRQGRLPAELAVHEEKLVGPCPLRATQLDSLLEVFEAFRDKRRGHGLRHRQPFVLACAALAMLMRASGYEAFEEECGKLTQRQLRALGCRQDPKTDRYRAPSDTTFFRVLNRLDAAEFDLRMGQWMMAQEISILQGLAIDGKCGGGGRDRARVARGGERRRRTVSALGPAPQDGTALGKGAATDPATRATVGEIVRLRALGAQGRARIGSRPLSGGDVAVLVRSNRQGRRIRDALLAARVPCVQQVQDSVFASAEAEELARVLRAVAEPSRDWAVRSCLTTDLFGVTGDELETLASNEAAWEQRLEKFRADHECWREHGFARMMRTLLRREGVSRRLLAFRDVERRLLLS